jgi:hypothetical protein
MDNDTPGWTLGSTDSMQRQRGSRVTEHDDEDYEGRQR